MVNAHDIISNLLLYLENQIDSDVLNIVYEEWKADPSYSLELAWRKELRKELRVELTLAQEKLARALECVHNCLYLVQQYKVQSKKLEALKVALGDILKD